MTTEKTLTEEFEKVRPQLKSFVLRMTASIEDTEDLIQETFIKSFQNIQNFKGNSSLKTWIFAIAPNGSKTEGKNECIAFWKDLILALDTQFTPEEVIVMGERAIILWRYKWAEGEENSVRGVNIMTVKNGLITEALGYVKAPLTN